MSDRESAAGGPSGDPFDGYAGFGSAADAFDESSFPGPPISSFGDVFRVYDVQQDGDRLLYFGEPLAAREHLLQRTWEPFREAGYEVRLLDRRGEHVLVAEPIDVGVDGIPWTNILLFVATVGTTLYAGSLWFHADLSASLWNVLEGWPFTVAIMSVLGIHELGHYAMSRYHKVDASLPYFIPIVPPIGTMGAVIRMKGRMPDRRALFDIGVAGPLAGLAATLVVTAVGLYLPPVSVPPELVDSANAVEIQLGYPPLLHGLSALTGQPLSYADPYRSVNPVVIGGWVGMFVTFLNLLPVGQLDGGHIVRAIVGRRQETVAAAVPALMFGMAGYLHYFGNVATNAVYLWVIWGFVTAVVAFVGPATPMRDDDLDVRRKAIGALTFVLGVLCFTPVPIQIVS